MNIAQVLISGLHKQNDNKVVPKQHAAKGSPLLEDANFKQNSNLGIIQNINKHNNIPCSNFKTQFACKINIF